MRWAETVIVGAGQAGLAVSHELTELGRDHVVLERGRVGERWRSERWDSLHLLTPNWLNVLPGATPRADADGFMGRDAFVAHLERYAAKFGAPVIGGLNVLSVSRSAEGYVVRTDHGSWSAANVVVASGASDLPFMPAVAASAPVRQLHSSAYRNPQQLGEGGVLVVGSGPSGQAIALELARAGRSVVLAAGRHARMPRRYRGRDAFFWLDAIGHQALTIDQMRDPVAARRAPSLPLSGRAGGADLDLGVLAGDGVRLAGRLSGFTERHALFCDDLVANVEAADRKMRRVLARIDEYIARLDMAPHAEEVAPVVVAPGPSSLDLHAEGIGTIVWATGYRRAYPWLHVPVFGANGEIEQRRGVTVAPGLYVVGLRFQHRRDSHFIGGVGRDATYVASRITRRHERARVPAARAA